MPKKRQESWQQLVQGHLEVLSPPGGLSHASDNRISLATLHSPDFSP